MIVPWKGANEDGGNISPYLLSEPRILRDVCRAMRRDDGGRRCPGCCVRQFCEEQARRAAYSEAAE